VSPLIPNQELVTAIQNLLGAVQLPGLTAASKHYDLFEAFLFALMVDAARDVAGVHAVHFEKPAAPGVATSIIDLRTAPGWMHNGPQYTHAVVDLGQREVEVHLGVYVAGRSKIPHEYDVCVVSRDEADRARNSGVAPRSSKVVLFLEAKHWAPNLRLPVAREFLGLCDDSGAALGSLVSNSSSPLVATLLAKRRPIGAFHGEMRTHGSPTRDELFHLARSALRRHGAG
jgi:hypothetical protein